jgi:hypothetical protein
VSSTAGRIFVFIEQTGERSDPAIGGTDFAPLNPGYKRVMSASKMF